MKIRNVFDRIFSMENLYAAYEDAARGRRYKKDILNWSFNTWEKLKDLQTRIYNGTYEIDRYHTFYVCEPKKRLIMSISFEHRIVQWAIYRIVNPMLVKGYIEDSYGCIPGRGVLSAMNRLHGWMQYVSLKNGKYYALKLDISKYFYRISHRQLKRILSRKIKDMRLLDLLYKIIDCENTAFGLPRWAKPEDVPLAERLFDVGMPIGNLLSQMFANLYLNELDQFCKRTLRIHYYIRYMDDIVILSDSKAELHLWEAQIRAFLLNVLELDLNQKTCIRPISIGVEFVGYKVTVQRVILRKSTTLRIKRSLAKVREFYSDDEFDFQKVTEVFEAYMSMLEHTDSDELKTKIFNSMVLVKKREEKQCGIGSDSGAVIELTTAYAGNT